MLVHRVTDDEWAAGKGNTGSGNRCRPNACGSDGKIMTIDYKLIVKCTIEIRSNSFK